MKAIRHASRSARIAAGLLLAGLTSAALAEDPQTGGSERQTLAPALIITADTGVILASLARNGFKGDLSTDDEGDPIIRSANEDQPFSIHFYACENHANCKFVQFTAGWNLEKGIPLEKVEEWNKNQVWGQAYRDEDKDPWFALAVNFAGGVTEEHLDDMVDWWKNIVADYEDLIGWKGK